jgi:hypothetical protein
MKAIYFNVFLILLFTLLQTNVFSQSQSESLDEIKILGHRGIASADEEKRRALFSQFSANLGMNFSGDKNSSGTTEIESKTINILIPISGKKDTIEILKEGEKTEEAIRKNYHCFSIQLINRVSAFYDSTKFVANQYVSTLQGSPFTGRLSYQMALMNPKKLDPNGISPKLNTLISGDIRLLPYSGDEKSIDIGFSYNGFFGLQLELKSFLIENGKVLDDGIFYLEPTYCATYGKEDMMKSIFSNKEPRALHTLDLRGGYRSNNKLIRDFGILTSYVFSDIDGPKFKMQVSVSP